MAPHECEADGEFSYTRVSVEWDAMHEPAYGQSTNVVSNRVTTDRGQMGRRSFRRSNFCQYRDARQDDRSCRAHVTRNEN